MFVGVIFIKSLSFFSFDNFLKICDILHFDLNKCFSSDKIEHFKNCTFIMKENGNIYCLDGYDEFCIIDFG